MQLKLDGSVSSWFTVAFLYDYVIEKGGEINVLGQVVYSTTHKNCTNNYVGTNLPPQSFGVRWHCEEEGNTNENKS